MHVYNALIGCLCYVFLNSLVFYFFACFKIKKYCFVIVRIEIFSDVVCGLYMLLFVEDV